jgi:hypothetical protein
MSVRAMTAVWQSVLPSADKLVMLALADSANDPDGVCWPAIPTIARKCGLTERGVQKIIERQGAWLDRNFRKNNSTLYRLRLELLPQMCDANVGGERGSPVNGSALGGERGSPKSSKNRKSVGKRAPVRDDFWPEAKEGTETAKRMTEWGPDKVRREVEKFIGYHQARGNLMVDWQRAWTTWCLSGFNGADNGTGTRGKDGRPGGLAGAAADFYHEGDGRDADVAAGSGRGTVSIC